MKERNMTYTRYAVYYTPPPGPLATFGAGWLGWDMVRGQTVPHIEVPGLPLPVADITETPRRYGFHATLKPPFQLAPDRNEVALLEAFDILGTRTLHPVTGLHLDVTPLGRFLALTAHGNTVQLNGLAALCVELLDRFRARPTEAELARRRKPGLSPAQEANLQKWGYPHVMDTFRFHMTLTGKLPKAALADTQEALRQALQDIRRAPFTLDTISLVGERPDGQFHLIRRHTLSA